jgi:hypothetical protein
MISSYSAVQQVVLAREYTRCHALPYTSGDISGQEHTSGDACSVQLPGYVLPARSEETIPGKYIFTKIFSREFFMEQGGTNGILQ